MNPIYFFFEIVEESLGFLHTVFETVAGDERLVLAYLFEEVISVHRVRKRIKGVNRQFSVDKHQEGSCYNIQIVEKEPSEKHIGETINHDLVSFFSL